MWIVGSDNKPNLIQITEFHQIIGDDQMPNMNGVERAKEKSGFFAFWFDVIQI